MATQSLVVFLTFLNICHKHKRRDTFKAIWHDVLSVSSTCMDLRPGLVVFLFSAGRAVAQIELVWTDWLNATWIMGGGKSRRAHPDKKFTMLSTTCKFPFLTLCFPKSRLLFFFNGHTDQPRDTNRTVVTPWVFTQSGLLARMKRSHWHIGWMDGRLWHVTAERHLQRENKPMDMSTSTEMTNKQAWTSWWPYLKHTLTDEGTIASKVQLLFVKTYGPNLTWARCLSGREWGLWFCGA